VRAALSKAGVVVAATLTAVRISESAAAHHVGGERLAVDLLAHDLAH
jgi:hypothetical protein